MDKIAKLAENCKYGESAFKQVLEEYYLPAKDQSWLRTLYTRLSSLRIMYAALMLQEGDIKKARQNFYLSAKSSYLLIKNYDEKLLDYDIKVICVALLSDCSDIINKTAKIKHSTYEALMKMGDSTINYVFQAAILDDWETFNVLMEIVKTKSIKKFPNYLHDYNFFIAFQKRDKEGCENAIKMLLEKRTGNARNKHNIYKDFFSFPALGYAKLARIKGIALSIDHELVPQALLEVQPNDSYIDEYEFLKE